MATQKLELEIDIDASGAITGIKKVDKAVKKSDKKAKDSTKSQAKALGKLKGAYLAVGAIITGVLGVAFIKVIKLASDAEENTSKFLTVFSGIKSQAIAVRDNLVNAFNLSSEAATRLLANTGDMLSGFGFTEEASLKLSDQVQQLSADLSSFANIPIEQASKAITKGLIGERESMKELGIAILESDVQQRLFEKGQKSLTGIALKQAKAQVTLELALAQSGKALGDVARTSGSFANQFRRLENLIVDTAVSIGTKLLPVLTPLLIRLNDFISGATDGEKALNKFKTASANLKDAQIEVNKAFKGTDENLKTLTVKQRSLAKILKDTAETKLSFEIRKLNKEYSDSAKITGILKGITKQAKEEFEAQERVVARLTEIEKTRGNVVMPASIQETQTLAEATKNLEERNISLIQAVEQETVFLKDSNEAKTLAAEKESFLISLKRKSIDIKTEETENFKLTEKEKKEFLDIINQSIEEDEATKLGNRISRLNELKEAENLTNMERQDAQDAIKQLEDDRQEAVTQKQFDEIQKRIGFAQNFANTINGISDKLLTLEKNRLQAQLDAGEISQAKANKQLADAALVNKRIQQATAVIDATVAVLKTLASVPFPANIPLGAAQAIFGATQVAIIQGQNVSGFQRGGTLGGQSLAGDRSLFRGNRGETILNTVQGQNLFDALDSAGLLASPNGNPVTNNASTTNNNDMGRVFNFHGPVTIDKDFESQVDRRLGVGGSFI